MRWRSHSASWTCCASRLLAGNEVVMSVSIGVVIADGTTDEPGALLRDADAGDVPRRRSVAWNRAEIFDDELRARSPSHGSTWADALAESRSIVATSVCVPTGVRAARRRAIGAEALLRWRHPSRGEAPTDFIGIAEETVITALGDAGCSSGRAGRR